MDSGIALFHCESDAGVVFGERRRQGRRMPLVAPKNSVFDVIQRKLQLVNDVRGGFPETVDVCDGTGQRIALAQTVNR